MWDSVYLLSDPPNIEETEEEAGWIVELLELQSDATILDLCCGHGRHGQLLANAGFGVIGIDNSRFMLEEAQRNGVKDRQSIDYIEADMRHLPLKPACDVVMNLFTSFGFFDDIGNQRVLSEVASVLKPKGKFLLDYWNPYIVGQLDGTRNWWWASESVLVVAEVEYDAITGQLFDYRTIIEQSTGTNREIVHRVRFYFPTELRTMLEAVGLRVQAFYGDFDQTPFSLEARRMIIVAEKLT